MATVHDIAGRQEALTASRVRAAALVVATVAGLIVCYQLARPFLPPLAWAFAHADVDAKRVGIGGFSDGASYALSLGLANGDLFSRIFAFSPGFIREATPVGKPVIDVFHGTRDRILPIDATSRRIVPRLRRQGYDVTYVEFDGPHTVLSEHERVALARLAGG